MGKEIKYPNLLAEMAKKGVTQKELAKIVGITQQSISRKLTGSNEWTIGEIETICNYFKSDYYQLFK